MALTIQAKDTPKLYCEVTYKYYSPTVNFSHGIQIPNIMRKNNQVDKDNTILNYINESNNTFQLKDSDVKMVDCVPEIYDLEDLEEDKENVDPFATGDDFIPLPDLEEENVVPDDGRRYFEYPEPMEIDSSWYPNPPEFITPGQVVDIFENWRRGTKRKFNEIYA